MLIRQASPAAIRSRILPGLAILMMVLVLLPASAQAQQSYVTRYDLFTGYTFLNSPHIGLFENGFHGQFGIRPKTWYSLGFDYSIGKGEMTLTPDLLPTELQHTLGTQLAQLAAIGRLPAGYSLAVKTDSLSQTFALGPQLAWRHFKQVTFFVRPSMGAIREMATPKPADPIASGIVAQLSPTGKKRDWQGFYGVGFGFDILASKHFALRTQADMVWDHLFNDLLKDGRWTTRFSIGPCFNFGKNIAEK